MRLQQAKADYCNPFGGVFLYLIGDIKQLPPVMDAAFFTPIHRLKGAAAEGKFLFDTMQHCFILSVSQRQRSDQQKFRDILDRLSSGNSLPEDHSVLMSRRSSNVPDYTTQWNDVLRLFPYTASVSQYNESKLLSLNVPIARIEAKCNNATAKSAPSEYAQGLEESIRLGKGARVMLRANLWTAKGLVNGALGTVEDLYYETCKRPPQDMPLAIMIVFDNYTGPCWPGTSVCPIPPITRSFIYKNISCTRTQLPLALAWATTIHKSQGLTMDKVVVDVGPKEIACGCSYVALTRVKGLDGLVFHPVFDFTRLQKLGKDVINNRLALESKLASLVYREESGESPCIAPQDVLVMPSAMDDMLDLDISFQELSFLEGKQVSIKSSVRDNPVRTRETNSSVFH